MCVNSLNTKTVCKNAAKNLAVLDFCINTHTHTHTHTHNSSYSITDITAGSIAVVELCGLQSPCSPLPCCACILPIATVCLT